MNVSFRTLDGKRIELSDIMPEDVIFHSMIVEIDEVEYIIKNTQNTLDIHMDGQMVVIPRAANSVWILDAETTYDKR